MPSEITAVSDGKGLGPSHFMLMPAKVWERPDMTAAANMQGLQGTVKCQCPSPEQPQYRHLACKIPRRNLPQGVSPFHARN